MYCEKTVKKCGIQYISYIFATFAVGSMFYHFFPQWVWSRWTFSEV